MELIENLAYQTYENYLTTHEAELKTQPAPQVAINYCRDGDRFNQRTKLNRRNRG